MITIVATQTVVPGKEAALQALMLDPSKVKAAEPGGVTFDWVRDTADPRRYVVIEQYADEAAYQHHTEGRISRPFSRLSNCLASAPAITICGDVVARPAHLAPSYFHIGVVVADLAAVIARYSDVLGVRFTEPATFKVPGSKIPSRIPASSSQPSR